MKKIEYIPNLNNYIRGKDLEILLQLTEKLFSNFNGGWGWINASDYIFEYPADLTKTIGFYTTKNTEENDASIRWNNLKFEYPESLKSVRVPVLNVLYLICKILNIEYSPTRDCIIKCNETYLKLEENG